MVSRYVKQRTGKGKTVGRSMQTEGNFGREQGSSIGEPQRQHTECFQCFTVLKMISQLTWYTCLQSLYTDLENIWAGRFKLLASIHRLSTQLYVEVLIVIYLVSQ